MSATPRQVCHSAEPPLGPLFSIPFWNYFPAQAQVLSLLPSPSHWPFSTPEYQQGFHEMVMLFQLMVEHDHETFWLFQFFLQKTVRVGPEPRDTPPCNPSANSLKNPLRLGKL